MEQRIYSLKTEFNDISLVRDKINNIFDSLKGKMDKLKLLYSDFIKNSKSQLFVFGLDSFHFQSKMIDLEYDDMIRMFLAINNRMYCEYFKLYKIIISYITENISDKKIIDLIKGNNFPVYKDVEPFKDYKFEIIIEVHENILILLNSIMSIVNHRENELSLHKNKQLIGLNIDNFVNSFNFEIVIMKEKIGLFLSYIEFFHKMHAKYLERFNNKILLMYNNINSDIHFDDNNVLQDKKNKDLKLDVNNNTSESVSASPSNISYRTTQNETSKHKTAIIPSIIKRGFKKMNNIINGCNTNKVIENTHSIQLDYTSDYNNSLSLSVFDDVVDESELLNIEDIYENTSFKSDRSNNYDMSVTPYSSDNNEEVVNEVVLDEEVVDEEVLVEEIAVEVVEEVVVNEVVEEEVNKNEIELCDPKIDITQKKKKKRKIK